MSSKPAKALGGKLKFKTKKDKAQNPLQGLKAGSGLVSLDDAMKVKALDKSKHKTEAEKRHLVKVVSTVESRTAKEVASKSYRERIEEYNQKLSTTTEHNDIPRVSAAGNG
jgi:protein FAM32A